MMATRTCATPGCGRPLWHRNTSGHCKLHVAGAIRRSGAPCCQPGYWRLKTRAELVAEGLVLPFGTEIAPLDDDAVQPHRRRA
jgi:hypothetical protein